jgi:hypothetical protein
MQLIRIVKKASVRTTKRNNLVSTYETVQDGACSFTALKIHNTDYPAT